MTFHNNENGYSPGSRREFLKSSSAAVGVGLAANVLVPKFAHGDTDGSATIQVGLIGCGGHGAGAAQNAIRADENCQLVAMADAFNADPSVMPEGQGDYPGPVPGVTQVI